MIHGVIYIYYPNPNMYIRKNRKSQQKHREQQRNFRIKNHNI